MFAFMVDGPRAGLSDFPELYRERVTCHQNICRIRKGRALRRFYQKVLDIYATSIDYQLDTELSQQFFATVQNKMHWAAHGHTAAEIVHERADGEKPFMGM